MTYELREIRIEKIRNGRVSNVRFWAVYDENNEEVFFSGHKVEAENFIKYEANK